MNPVERKGVAGLMRKGRREVLLLLMVFLIGIPSRAARNDNKKPAAAAGSQELVGITIELSWSLATVDPAERAGDERERPSSIVSLGVTEGRVADVVPWPAPESSPGPGASKAEPAADGSWPLGTATAGRVRARVEATLGADLIVRRDSRLVRIPVAAVLERPQHTPDQSALIVECGTPALGFADRRPGRGGRARRGGAAGDFACFGAVQHSLARDG